MHESFLLVQLDTKKQLMNMRMAIQIPVNAYYSKTRPKNGISSHMRQKSAISCLADIASTRVRG